MYLETDGNTLGPLRCVLCTQFVDAEGKLTRELNRTGFIILKVAVWC